MFSSFAYVWYRASEPGLRSVSLWQKMVQDQPDVLCASQALSFREGLAGRAEIQGVLLKQNQITMSVR